MRPLECPYRHDRSTSPIDKPSNAVWIVGMPGNLNVEVIEKADQAAIEHPMRGAGQSDTIGQDIGPFRLNRPYVDCIDFGASSVVDGPQARKSLGQSSASELPLGGWAG